MGALVGAALGWAVVDTAGAVAPEVEPQDFVFRQASVALGEAQHAGALAPANGVVDLAVSQAFAPRQVFHYGVVELDARVPEGGQLSVSFGGEIQELGPQAPSAGRAPGAVAPTGQGAGTAANPPGPAPGAQPQGRRPVSGLTLRVDRARMEVGVQGLRCQGQAQPPEQLSLRMETSPKGLKVWQGETLWLRCQGRVPSGQVVVASGVRRIQVQRLSVASQGGERVWVFERGAAGAEGAALGAVFGALLLYSPSVFVPLLALLLYPLLAPRDWGKWLDAMRLLRVEEGWAPALILSPWVLGVGLVSAAKRLPLWGLGALAVLPALVVSGTVILSHVEGGYGMVLLALVSLPWAGVAWVNTHPFARRPLLSYLGLGLCLVLGELGVRMMPLSQDWTRTAGWERASAEFEELMELRQYRSYPSEGFPVRPPEPREGVRRVVALGGSSTGGAYQMDDIELFWPARLQEHMRPGWEVVNQGVGGWNTLHISLYSSSQMQRLEPDVVVLYVGHNDILTPSVVPYSQLYAQYRPSSPRVARISAVLHSLRLFNGFKFLVLSLKSGGGAVAVPVSDARQNLLSVIADAHGVGAQVLLVTEGLNPDPAPMQAYNRMLEQLAEQDGVRHLNGAALLYQAQDPTLFIDDCHLSVKGHRVLAQGVRGALEGWE